MGRRGWRVEMGWRLGSGLRGGGVSSEKHRIGRKPVLKERGGQWLGIGWGRARERRSTYAGANADEWRERTLEVVVNTSSQDHGETGYMPYRKQPGLHS